MKKIIALLIVVVTFTLVSCSDTKQGENPKRINIGILRVPNDETLAIASGIFDKYFTEKGIECNFIVFDSGVQANKALASGSVDFATMGNTNAIIALASNIDVEMIWIHEVLGEIEALAVKNNSEIKEVKDLEGRRVATPFASTSHYILLNVLKEAGIENKVELLNMRTPEIVAAWERGDIDSAYTWQPSLGKLLEDGKMLISSEDMIKKGYVTANVAVVRTAFSEKYPDLVRDFISVLIEAGKMYRANPEKSAEIVAKELEITKEDALLQMKGSLWLSPQELLEKEYFGKVEEKGDFAKIMKDTSDFLKNQNSINESPSQEAFNIYVNSVYIERALERKN